MAAGTPWTNPSGGFWPLGKITIAAAGTPVPINTNVGAQGQKSLQMARRIRGLIFSNMISTTAGDRIYVLKHGYTKTQTNGIIAILICGTSASAATNPQPIQLPPGELLRDALPTPDFFDLDADTSGASVQVTAIYG